jgi:hypothetical protein
MKSRLASGVDSAFVLAQAIHLAVGVHIGLLHTRSKSFECVYLLEYHEIAFIAALDG